MFKGKRKLWYWAIQNVCGKSLKLITANFLQLFIYYILITILNQLADEKRRMFKK